jgi:hypothetical protein
MNEFANFTPPYTTIAYSVPPIPPQGSDVPRGLIPDNVYDELLKRAPVGSVQTMAPASSTTHHLVSVAQTSSSGSYEAGFCRFKDLANMIKTKLGVDMGNSHLYQKPYAVEFDLVSYPTSWRVPDFMKFNGDDNRTTWEHIIQYIAQLGEVSFSDAIRVRLFSSSLTRTAFSWFSSLAPNSIQSWNQLEHKFHDHFYSGDNEVKLTDLTSVKQGRDEFVTDYFKRFKDIKNCCFSLPISKKDLADLAFGGLRLHYKEKLEGFDFLSINQVQVRALSLEYKFKNSKDTYKTHRSKTHVIDCESDTLDDEEKEFTLPILFGHLRPNHIHAHQLSRLKIIGKRKCDLPLMFLYAIVYFMSCIEAETSSCLMPYRRLRSRSGVHTGSGIILHVMQLMIVMFSIDRYNRPLMKDDWFCLRCILIKHYF